MNLKKLLKYTFIALFIGVLVSGVAYAASILTVPGGGTGAGTFPTKRIIVSNSTKATGTLQSLAAGTDGTFLRASSSATSGFDFAAVNGSGSVTSVDMTVPTGLAISGNPIITTGTLALSLAAGYNIPLSASTTNWNNFFDFPLKRIGIASSTNGSGISVSTSSPNTITLNIPTAATGITGQLTGTDWSTFNNKVGTSSALTTNFIPIITGANTIGNSSISQSAGITLINGVSPIIDGGGDWLNNIIQTSGVNFIVQTPTSTAVLGNTVLGGGVSQFNATTYMTPSQFCSGGLFYASSSTAFTVYLPTMSQIGYGIAPSSCTTAIYSGNWSPQFIYNAGSAAVTSSASGTNETLMYAPGGGPITYPGMSAFAAGQFTASSTILGATTTGMTLNGYLVGFQPTSTQPTTMGQILAADQTGHGWALTNLVSGSNLTVTTSTLGQITLAVVSSPSFSGTLNVTGKSTFTNSSSTSASFSSDIFDKSNNKVLGYFDKSFNLSSTTPDYLGKSFNTATYTVPSIYNPSVAVTLTKLYCKTDTGTVLITFAGNNLSCTSSGASSSPSTNIAVEGTTAVTIGTAASSPNWLTVTASWRNQ